MAKLQTIRSDGSIVNHTDLGKAIGTFAKANTGFMVKQINAGFLDGGCLPLALSLQSLFATVSPDVPTRIVSVGRISADHAALEVIHPKYGKIYLDGDGAADAESIINKMIKVELLDKAEIFNFEFDQDDVLSYEEIGLPAKLLQKLNDSDVADAIRLEIRQGDLMSTNIKRHLYAESVVADFERKFPDGDDRRYLEKPVPEKMLEVYNAAKRFLLKLPSPDEAKKLDAMIIRHQQRLKNEEGYLDSDEYRSLHQELSSFARTYSGTYLESLETLAEERRADAALLEIAIKSESVDDIVTVTAETMTPEERSAELDGLAPETTDYSNKLCPF